MTAALVQILDACVLINLLASGEMEAILGSAARTSFICSAVEKEAIYLRTDDPNSPTELVHLAPYVEAGLLTVCHTEGDEEAQLFVDYASVLDDGEAMSLAIALARGFVLATDERKARRLFLEAAGSPQRLVSTSDLIRGWAEGKHALAGRLKTALARVEGRARYLPPADDANYNWWVAASRP